MTIARIRAILSLIHIKEGVPLKIKTSVTIPDYVYDFYKKGAAQLNRETPEKLMKIALEQYAGMVAKELLNANGISLDDD